jgi:ATP-dependent DNA helicase RecQ
MSSANRNEWQRKALESLQRRLRQAKTPADIGVLLREAARIGEGTAALQISTALPSAESLARFGVRAEPATGAVTVHLTSALPPSLPVELRDELERVLPVDTHLRRPDVPASADAVLRRLTTYARYRNPTQKAAVRALLTMPDGAALLATMATGTGKSLLFQLGIRWWREKAHEAERPCAVVLVPTVSLALNHLAAARSLPGLEGSRALTGDTSGPEREDVRVRFLRGEVPLLFVAPEAALGTLRNILVEAAGPMSSPDRTRAALGRVHAVFVDEAHIVASWGRSFRPDLQRIPGLVRMLRAANPALRTVLLSATVDDMTRALLRHQYGEAVWWLEVAEEVPRREFDIVSHRFRDENARDDAVLALADVLPRPALVYTTKREHAAKLEASLHRDRGFERVALFTGDTTGEERAHIVGQWRNGELDLVVATSAFGMGIDQDDVRAVIHACMPEDASRYYQEIGRAGRDGHQAFAILLYADEDHAAARGLIARNIMGIDKARPRWRALLNSAVDDGTDEWSGLPRFRLDLDARGEHLENDYSGRRNRTWNKSLLVQLQRYGALEIISSEQDASRWQVVFHPDYVALSDAGACDGEIAALFSRHHDEESRRALDSLDTFARIWEADDLWSMDCCLAAFFSMVEAGHPTIGACGRCFVCRAVDEPPAQTDRHGGVSARWRVTARSFLPTRLLLTGHGTPPAHWIGQLAEKGIEQLVVPDSQADATVEAWGRCAGDPGWVLTWNEVLRTPSPVVPLHVPTALVLPGTSGPEVDRAWTWRRQLAGDADPVTWVVASAGTRVCGRDLEDVASIRAPVRLKGFQS